jgi:hypothetical protein
LLPYLAAFDGHKEIFLVGYNQYTNAGNSAWTTYVEQVIKAYATTKFIVVGARHHTVESWLEHPNVEQMEFRQFISYCDV